MKSLTKVKSRLIMLFAYIQFFTWKFVHAKRGHAKVVGLLSLVIGCVIIVVALPILAAMLAAGASAGVISMQTTIIQFMPIFGIGAALSILGAFGLYRAAR